MPSSKEVHTPTRKDLVTFALMLPVFTGLLGWLSVRRPGGLRVALIIVTAASLIAIVTGGKKWKDRALSLFITMVIGYLASAAFGLIDLGTVARADWVSVPQPFPSGGLAWPGLIAVITVVVCFFATAVETTGHTLAVSRIVGVTRISA